MPQLRESTQTSIAADNGLSKEWMVHDEPHRFSRIFGIETEYGISVTGNEKPCGTSEIAMRMFRPVVSRARSTNTYLNNGSRLYLDVGSHPEYATAEARDPLTALEQDLAGERLMSRLARNAEVGIRATYGEGAQVHLFKNNVDSQGHSFGCHENYLVRRFVSLQQVERQLLPFLITRQIFSGAGRLIGTDGDVRFEISQRADYLDEAVSSSTTRARPMVNTRDEPHANPEQYRRLHVIIGDSNRSQFATMMKLATTHLVLCVIEESVRLGIPSGLESCALVDPSAANRAISRDVTGRLAQFDMEDIQGFRNAQRSFMTQEPNETMEGQIGRGGSDDVNALAMQRYYYDVVVRFMQQYGAQLQADLPRVNVHDILRQWADILQSIQSGDIDALSHRIDWAAKYRLLNALRRRHPNLDALKLTQIDMNYHDIVHGSAYDSMLEHGAMQHLLSESEIERALNDPPHDTRAVLRGRFVERALHHDAQFSCDWTRLTLAHPQRMEAVLMDPFDTSQSDDYQRIMHTMSA